MHGSIFCEECAKEYWEACDLAKNADERVHNRSGGAFKGGKDNDKVRDKAYQRSHHEQPCTFAGHLCHGDVVGHHIRVKNCGTGKKMSDAVVIPVCHYHHKMCDKRTISTQHQLNEWCKYMLERLTQEYGQTEAVERLAMAYWDALNG